VTGGAATIPDMSDSPPAAPVRDFVQAILEVTAPITQMLDQMMRAPDEPDIHDVVMVMKRLLEDVLTPLEGDADLTEATRLVDAAATLVIENLYALPQPERPQRRGTSRRRRRGH
jgi:hypothetical protein